MQLFYLLDGCAKAEKKSKNISLDKEWGGERIARIMRFRCAHQAYLPRRVLIMRMLKTLAISLLGLFLMVSSVPAWRRFR